MALDFVDEPLASLGRVEVRETFHVSKIGTIAGCYVVDGKILRNAKARLVRDSVVVWEGEFVKVARFKNDLEILMDGRKRTALIQYSL